MFLRGSIIVLLLMASFLFADLAAGPGTLIAQAESVPENARANTYGSGWECERGFREDEGRCVTVNVPANAYPTGSLYGRGWECKRGYRRDWDACVAIEVPENAYLNASGDAWECERGYIQRGGSCLAITVPPNGYLTNSGNAPGWQCERGYQVVRGSCLAVAVPENAHLDGSGSDWECDQPYRRRGQACILP